MEKNKNNNKFKSILMHGRVPLVLLTCAALSIAITFVLYNYTQVLLKERLQERLVSIVATSSQEISASNIVAIGGVEDLYSDELEILVGQLERMREANADITYAYIMRRTSDANTFEFVTDADSLIP